MKYLAASAVRDGCWIYVDYPAADQGWYQVTHATHAGGWSEFDCGRPIPYVIGSRAELRWSPNRPVGA